MTVSSFRTQGRLWIVSCGLLSLSAGFVTFTQASTGMEVFRGFTTHISQQIVRDKQAFYVAQSCTTWFYKKSHEPQAEDVERISYTPASTDSIDLNCPTRYPAGLDQARQAFAETQQSLSISLTFYEFALVGDRDDDGQYAGEELRDVIESFGETFDARLPAHQYLTSLNGVFDDVTHAGKIERLTKSMGVLLSKGYRFTSSDRAALSRELNN